MDSTVNKFTIEVASRFYAALGSRNIGMIMKLIPEQLDWYVPGNETIAPWLGYRKTHAEIIEFFKLLWENTEPVSAAIHHMAADGNVVLSSGNFETLMIKTGKKFKSVFFTEITVVDGLIVKYRLLEDTLGLTRALSHHQE